MILYSFRRCPFAMRARYALRLAGFHPELREVKLSNKPIELIALSTKATVPVLEVDGKVIDESLEIMLWALNKSDNQSLLNDCDAIDTYLPFIKNHDQHFKPLLDRYKYFDRYPDQSQSVYFDNVVEWLFPIEHQLKQTPFLFGSRESIADAAIAPFLRQCSLVDIKLWQNAPLPSIRRWLDRHLSTQTWASIMHKYTPWSPSDTPIYF